MAGGGDATGAGGGEVEGCGGNGVGAGSAGGVAGDGGVGTGSAGGVSGGACGEGGGGESGGGACGGGAGGTMVRGADSSAIAVSSRPSASTTDDTLKRLAADQPSVLASPTDRGAPSASTTIIAAIPIGSGVSRTISAWSTLSRAATRLAFSDGGVISSDNGWLALGAMDWRIVKSCGATCNWRRSVASAVPGVTVQEEGGEPPHTEVRMAEATCCAVSGG